MQCPSEKSTQADAVGPGTEDGDAASVRADHCVPSASGVYYFEIEVR